jgi:hypothetical protein
LTALIARAQAAIDAHCRQTFEASADTTRYFDAVRDVSERSLFLDAPLCAVTSVTNGDGSVIASTKYTTEPRNSTPWHTLRLKGNAGVAWSYTSTPEDAIVIVGKWAYSTTAPVDVVQACARLAAYLYKQRDNALDLDRTVIVGDTTIMPLRIPGDVLTLLRPYRRLIT